MEDKIVSLETAKLLNDLNIKFNEYTTISLQWSKSCHYKTKIPFEPKCFLNGEIFDNFVYNLEDFKVVFKESEKWLDVQFPTQSLLAKWLRERHELFVQVFYHKSGKFECMLVNSSDNLVSTELFQEMFNSYEDAFESGLLEALKLVKDE